MSGDGINDGKFTIKRGGLSQAIVSELDLNPQQTKQIGSIWSQIFAEVDKQQEQNIEEGKARIYSGGNDLKGSARDNYKVYEGQVIEFSKTIWANIVNLVKKELKTNIQIQTQESTSVSDPVSTTPEVADTDNGSDAPKNTKVEDNGGVNNSKKPETEPEKPKSGDSGTSSSGWGDILSRLLMTPTNIAEDLIKEIFGGRANLDDIMPNINADNILEVLDKYKELSDEKNTKMGVLIDDETLIEAILDETIPNEKKKEYINHIKDALIEKLKRIGGETESIARTFDKAIDAVLKYPTGLQSSKVLDKLISEFIEIYNQVKEYYETGYRTRDGFDERVYVDAITDILEDEGINTEAILGNGKFDNESKQKTGNCWVHAGINAMTTSEKGRQYLEKIVYKHPHTGSIVVYLPGAKAKGLPQPKGDGIYTYTEKEILDRCDDTSYGDGDYTALMLAVEDFRKEDLNDPNATSATGSVWKFCELIFGTDENAVSINSKKDLIKALKNGLPIFVSLPNSSILGEGYENGGPHGLALKTIDINRGVAILIDSNAPNEPVELSLDDLFNHAIIHAINIPS